MNSHITEENMGMVNIYIVEYKRVLCTKQVRSPTLVQRRFVFISAFLSLSLLLSYVSFSCSHLLPPCGLHHTTSNKLLDVLWLCSNCWRATESKVANCGCVTQFLRERKVPGSNLDPEKLLYLTFSEVVIENSWVIFNLSTFFKIL